MSDPSVYQPLLLARAIRDGSLNWQTGLETIASGSPATDAKTLGAATATLVREGLLVKVGNRVWEPTVKGRTEGVRPHDYSGMAGAIDMGDAPDPIAPRGKPKAADRTRALAARLATAQAAITAAGEIPDDDAREALRLVAAKSDDWRLAVPAMFPSVCTSPFAPFHEEFLDWVWSIGQGETPRPYCSFWSRGASKSSLCEMAAVLLGHRRVRKYVLIVSGKQAKADDHVASIADLLESAELAAVDPDLCERRLGKYGSSKGWRRNRLTTKAGFTIDAVGLDSDIRGARIGTDRVDAIVFDDVDSLADSPETTLKKINRITKDLLGTQGEEGIAIMFVQNLIHSKTIAASLADMPDAPKIDFMTRRIVSGPIPAVTDLAFEDRYDEEIDRNRIVITGGVPTWPEGFGLDRCQAIIDTEGITAFLTECQHVDGTLDGGMFDSISFETRRRGIADLPPLKDNGTWIGPCGTWIDPAVTSKDKSDSCAVCTGGLARDRKMWFLDSWERISTPEEATLRGLESAMRWGSQVLGFEVDQGGDTWEVVYKSVVRDQLDDPGSYTYQRHNDDGVAIPKYAQRRATSDGQMSKRQRIAQMMARYQTDQFRHFDEGCVALEAGLKRFPKYKPYDIADSCLVAGTMVATAHGPVPIERIAVGDIVWTHEGLHPVTAAGLTGYGSEIVQATMADGATLTGTFDHPVWTVEHGWMPLGMSGGLTLVPLMSWSIQQKLPTTAGYGADTPTRNAANIASTITSPDLERAAMERPSCCTGRCTKTTMDRSLTAGTSTTRTTTPSTTFPPTLRPSQGRTTCENTCKAESRPPTNWNTWNEFAISLLSGTVPTKDAPGMWNTAGSAGRERDSTSTHVRCAESGSRLADHQTLTALEVAATRLTEPTPSTWSRWNARNAASPSEPTREAQREDQWGSVPSRVVNVQTIGRADVYNLEVPGPHTFFANGVLVHNSYHTFRWLAENGGENTARRMTTKRAQGSLPEVRPHQV